MKGMSLKDKAIVQGSVGFGLGVIICTVITAVTSTDLYADGTIHLCAREYAEAVGNELTAFVIQSVLLGLYGALGMGGAVVYEIEEWSILRVTLTHFCTLVTAFFALAFYLRWVSITDGKALLELLLMFVIPYAVIWLVNYLAYKLEIRRINDQLAIFKATKAKE